MDRLYFLGLEDVASEESEDEKHYQDEEGP